MTPDGTSIPEDDAIARAARDALGSLAGPGSTQLSWNSVQAGARRLRTRRVVAAVAACAVVFAGAGTAAAVIGGRGTGPAAPVAGHGSTTTTETSSSTSTSEPAPSTSAPDAPPQSAPSAVDSTTTTVAAPPVAQPGDLAGTISLASNVLYAEHIASVTLTLRNVSDHTVALPDLQDYRTGTGVYMDYFDAGYLNELYGHPELAILTAGQERTFTASIEPRAEAVGPETISAAFMVGFVMQVGNGLTATIAGVPTVSVTVVPPDYVEGQPLDPALGQWTATMAAAAPTVRAGESVAVFATLRNDGDQAQLTRGYGALTVVCQGNPQKYSPQSQLITAATLAPGAEQTFAVEFRPDLFVAGDVTCSVGLSFRGSPEFLVDPRKEILTDHVDLDVLPAPDLSPTTTENTTSATSP